MAETIQQNLLEDEASMPSSTLANPPTVESVSNRLLRRYETSSEIVPNKPAESIPVPISSVSLAVHGQGLHHLLGDQERGIDGVLNLEHNPEDIRLVSKEEGNLLGKRISAESMFGGGAPGEAGEARISYYLNHSAGYGEVLWVTPTYKVMEGGGVIQSFNTDLANHGLEEIAHINDETGIGGLHGESGEIGYFTPCGATLNLIASRQHEVNSINSILARPASPKEAMKTFLLDTKAKDLKESFDEYSQRVFGKPIDQLTDEEVKTHISLYQSEIQSEIPTLTSEAAEFAKEQVGVSLLQPETTCFIPEENLAEVQDRINAMVNLTNLQRQQLLSQIHTYPSEDQIGVANRIAQLASSPAEYAELILPTMQISLGRTDLSTDEVVQILTSGENSIGWRSLLQVDKEHTEYVINN